MHNKKILADLDEIVFEGREQNYGAYQMRKQYERYLTRATLIAMLMFVSLTGLPKVLSWVLPKAEVAPPELVATEVDLTALSDMMEKEEEEEEIEEIPELPAAPPPPVQTIAFLIPKPTADPIDPGQTIADIANLDSAAIGLIDIEGDKGTGSNYNFDDLIGKVPGGTGEWDLPEGKTTEIPPDSFVMLDKEPQPVNMDELKSLIGYPKLALEAGIEGKVVLRVMIDKMGNYIKHIIVKDPHPILTKAVADKIHLLKMTPGIQARKPISVWVTVPVDFQTTNK